MSDMFVFLIFISLIIIGFLFYCLLFRTQDASFSFLNLFRHKRRTYSVLFAIALGDIAIFLYGGFVDYSFWILKEQTVRTNIGHVQLVDKNYFETSNKSKTIISDYPRLKQEILSSPDLAPFISEISGQLEFSGIISNYDSEVSSYFSAMGIEPLPALKLGSFDKTIRGSDLSQKKNNEITIGDGLAKTLNVNYSNWLDLIVANAQGGQGAMSLKLRGIFSSGIKDYDDVALKLPLETAQKMMDTQGVSKIVFLLKDDKQIEKFTVQLTRFLKDKKLPLIVKTWKEISPFYKQVEGLLSGIYFFIKVLVTLIVIFMISNALTMSIIERTKEITTLRAIGLKPKHILRLLLLEGTYIGVIGAVVSLALGYLIATLINIHGIPMPPSPGQTQGYTAFISTHNAEILLLTLILPVITSTLASIFPAIRASRLAISDAFKFS